MESKVNKKSTHSNEEYTYAIALVISKIELLLNELYFSLCLFEGIAYLS